MGLHIDMIGRNGGEEQQERVRIRVDEPVEVRYEKGFEGHFPVKIMDVPREKRSLLPEGPVEYQFDFTGKGFVLNGGAGKLRGTAEDADLHLEVIVDGAIWEEALLPTSFQSRRNEVTWRYNLEDGDHTVKVVWRDTQAGYRIDLNNVIVYGPEPAG